MATAQIEELMERYDYLVKGVAARSFSGCREKEDLYQEGRLGLWRAAKGWDGVRPFPPYAAAAIRNAMRNYVTRRPLHRREEVPLDSLPDLPAPGDEEGLIDELDYFDRIQRAWGPNSRERLILVSLARGVTKQALAAGLGLSTAQVSRIAKRAYGKMEGEK